MNVDLSYLKRGSGSVYRRRRKKTRRRKRGGEREEGGEVEEEIGEGNSFRITFSTSTW